MSQKVGLVCVQPIKISIMVSPKSSTQLDYLIIEGHANEVGREKLTQRQPDKITQVIRLKQ